MMSQTPINHNHNIHPREANRSSQEPLMPIVAVITRTTEITDLLRILLEDEGFIVATAYIHEFRQGQLDPAAFCATHQLNAVIYEITLPYQSAWQFFQQHFLPACGLPSKHFILTTKMFNPSSLAGLPPTLKLIEQPFDIQEIITAVWQAVR
jgi:hypothetical protein